MFFVEFVMVVRNMCFYWNLDLGIGNSSTRVHVCTCGGCDCGGKYDPSSAAYGGPWSDEYRLGETCPHIPAGSTIYLTVDNYYSLHTRAVCTRLLREEIGSSMIYKA